MNGKANTWQKLLDQRHGALFINREREQELFRLNFLYQIPAYLIFAISGPDGIGKSALLARYRTIAREHDALSVAVDATYAMVTRDQTILHVMVSLAQQFEASGIRFSAFLERYDEYLACMQMLAKDFNAAGGMYDLLSSVADVQTMQGEAWDKFLFERFGSLAKIALVKSPVVTLTQVFARDMNAWATIRPMLLCFDDWDDLGPHLEAWLQGLLSQHELRTNIWVVVAGRQAIDDAWDVFRPVTVSFALLPFTESEVRAFAAVHNVVDPARVTDIVTFSGGAPALVNLLTRARGGSASDLALTPVDRFLKWVDDPHRREIVLACAVVRRLDEAIVESLIPEPDAASTIDWLAESGLLVQHEAYLHYHPTLRARLLAYAQQQTPGILHNAHTRLLAYYRRLSFVEGEPPFRNERWRIHKIEALYHGLMVADTLAIQEGVELFLRALRAYAPLSGEIVATWQQAAAMQLTRNAVVEWGELLQRLWRSLESRRWEAVLDVCDTLAEREDNYTGPTRYALQVLRDVAQSRLPRPEPETAPKPEIAPEPEVLPEPEVAAEPESVLAQDVIPEPEITLEPEIVPEPKVALEPVPPVTEATAEPVTLVEPEAELPDVEAEDKTVPLPSLDIKEAPIKEPEPAPPVGADEASEIADVAEPDAEVAQPVALPPEEVAEVAVPERVIDATAEDYTRRADAYLAMGEYEAAVVEYGKAIELDPDFEKALYNRGLAHAQRAAYADAIADFTRVLALNPEHAAAFYNRGLVYVWQNDFEAAIADYDQALALNPEDAVAYNSRGNAHYRLRAYQRAIGDYDQAIWCAPDYADAYLNRGLAYATLEEYQQAIADYNQAVALNPESAVAYNNRGLAYARLQQYARAMEDYTLALTLDPRYAVAYNNLGLCYVRLGNHAQAIVEYQRAADIAPQYATAHYNAACAAGLMGDAVTACIWLEKAIRLNPRYQAMAQRDTDFDAIRNDTAFQALLA